MPLALDIREQDIDEIGKVLGADLNDANRRNALVSKNTCDVQACPGSGKTTLLVAKLAILARKWTWRDQGLCVLSHTNAARHEVEHRLVGYPSAYHLLGYPHFVGTIQAFVDRFLALPSLRECGLEVAMVDNDRSADKAEKLLQKCYTAKAFLGRRANGLDIARGLRLDGPNLSLGSSEGAIPCGQDSATFKELCRLKGWLCKDGIFRYDDMYAFAERYVTRYPWVVQAIRHRFRWVFIDEMQDTDALQDRLLRQLFQAGCILHRFGDSNQAIFRGMEVDAQTSFPDKNHVGLPDSKRFGQPIANLVTPLTQAVSPQNLIGNPNVPSRKHTVFLFGADTITRVLPAFGELLAKEFVDGLPAGFVAKAIGFRKTPPTEAESDKLPFSLGHYQPDFDPNLALKSDRPSLLAGFVHKAKHIRSCSGECGEAAALIFDGVLELLYIAGAVASDGQRFTKARLADTLMAVVSRGASKPAIDGRFKTGQ